jgi:glyoxylase-like metal-dependent hydrolase (beta-lactamase superfamily II)
MPATPSVLPDYLEPLSDGLYAIDTGFLRPRFDAAYLLTHAGRAAFIDTGTAFAVPRLLGALQALGLGLDAVDYVIPTHVHLDHAGGVGTLMRELPNAQVVVHPSGARHMVDPSTIWAGALAVYGQAEMERSYGVLTPVPAERVLTTQDGQTIEVGGRALRVAHTPGHARHHHCLWDATSRGWFAGDTFGLSYREFDTAAGGWISPAATPVQFEPDALVTSVRRLLAEQPQWMYVTHYSRIGNVSLMAQRLLNMLDAMVAMGQRLQHAPQRHEALKAAQLELFCTSLAAHGCTLPHAEIQSLLHGDLELNAQGIAIWLDRSKITSPTP